MVSVGGMIIGGSIRTGYRRKSYYCGPPVVPARYSGRLNMHSETTTIPSLSSSRISDATPLSRGPESESDELLWDVSECLRQLECEADTEVLHDIVSAYVEDSRQRIERLRQAVSNGQTTELREQVHSLKGSSIQVGAKQMASVCRCIERCCSERSIADLPVLLDQLGATFVSTSRAMLDHANGSSS
jgi:histidine phosphotransfer protein HptB